jgi:hypothetical protein
MDHLVILLKKNIRFPLYLHIGKGTANENREGSPGGVGIHAKNLFTDP